MTPKNKSRILKAALFATGVSGIVAEYNLSTLASYFIGDSVTQWTLIVSVMLFSMGLGSRISKIFENKLLQKFIYIEFLLSILVAFSSLSVFVMYSYSAYADLFIYLFSIIIGVLIGMEIPLVIRINNEYESLKVNVSSVIEKDYYGSLVGGIFFAFIGLPYFGISYTPFILGIINFTVALLLLIILWQEIKKTKRISWLSLSAGVFAFLILGLYSAKPIIFHSEQKRYKDKIVLSEQSKYQKVVITEWNNEHWLYINNNQQLCSIDEVMYHEPLVHPAAKLSVYIPYVLVMGGGDGCAVRELLKYPEIKSITLVDLDPLMTNLGKTNDILLKMNENSLNNPKVHIINKDAFKFIEDTKQFFNLIIIDLPDPRSVELNKLYSEEFYSLCKRKLLPSGTIVTQAGSPYYATQAFECINKTMSSAGFNTLRIHNQITTMGEWGWVIGKRNMNTQEMKENLRNIDFSKLKTKWLNNESINLITSFGKNLFLKDSVEVNKIHNPVLYRYYLKGNWSIY